MFVRRIQRIYSEYPRHFWVVICALFIDRLGGALVFPFIALFITARFAVGMVEVGQLFAIFAVTSIFGSTLGGALTDRFGRKAIIIFGLIVSALTALMFGFAEDLNFVYLIGVVVGLFGNIGGPAQQAMVADILPEQKRIDGFGLLRIVANLAVTIGPAVGGLLATGSYLWLFIVDAVASIVTAFIVFFAIPETKPQMQKDDPRESLFHTLTGYFKVFGDRLFVAFIFASVLMVAVYVQMNSTLSVYLRDVHGVPDHGYGYILSLNAGMVVVLQFWITRRIKRISPMIVMALGTMLLAIGFSLYGFVSTYALFMAAMVIITIGEMFVAPVGQALAANFAPRDMRGRYLAMYGFSWTIPLAFSPLVAGLIMDNYSAYMVWYLCGVVSIFAVACYLALHRVAKVRFEERVNSNQD